MNVLLLTHPEEGFSRCSLKKAFLKILQISQESTYVGVSLIKLKAILQHF